MRDWVRLFMPVLTEATRIAAISAAFFVLLSLTMARWEKRQQAAQNKAWARVQEQLTAFKADLGAGSASGQVQVIEKHHYKRDVVHELPPDIQERLDALSARVDAVAAAVLTVPGQSASGVADYMGRGVWEYTGDRVRIRFALEDLPPDAFAVVAHAVARVQVETDPVRVSLRVVRASSDEGEVAGVQRWYVHATDDAGHALAVESFEVKVPELQTRRHWWQSGKVKFGAGLVGGIWLASLF